MSGLTFYLVDVFGQEKFAGNQLAVFIDAGNLATETMQKIANEMHFSETTFVLSSEKRDGGFDVRIFTPNSEIPFAGHPTLGTAYVIKRFIAAGQEDSVVLNLKVGQIPVIFQKGFDYETLWVKQVPPVFCETFTAQRLARVLQLDEADLDPLFPVQEVSTGLPFIIVPLKTLEATKRATVNVNVLREMASEVRGGILVFCPQTVDKCNSLHVRVFVDLLGIPEDPATGSGNGCLAGYLSRYRYFGTDNVAIRVEQGIELGRPSLLLLKAYKTGDDLQVEVGGRVFLVAEGKLA
jgi:trans-2,3-dihydro-3-hydroxyanthranilate isomerase